MRFLHRYKRFLHRYKNLLNLKCGILEKVKAFFYLTLFYFLCVFKIEELKAIKGTLCLTSADGRNLHIVGLNATNNIHTFIEIFLDDCYDLNQNKREEVFVLDLGANIGLFPIGLYYFGWRPSFYIGIEPMPKNLEILSKNLSSLFKPKSYLVIPMALNKKSNLKKKFSYNYGASRSLEYSYCSNLNAEKIEEVDTISMTDFLKIVERHRPFEKPVFFKMDIEGGEWGIKEELIKFLKEEKSVRYLGSELHFFKPGSKFESDVEEFLGTIKNIFGAHIIRDDKGANITLSGIRK